VADPEPAGDHFRHYFQLTWNGGDLASLLSLTLSHPGSLRVISGGDNKELSIILPVDIQRDGHEAIASTFENEMRAASAVVGTDPVIQIPRRHCAETPRSVSGLCVRSLIVVVPASKLLDVELAWDGSSRIEGAAFKSLKLHMPPSGIQRVIRIAGEIELLGGGDQADILVDRVSANALGGARLISRLQSADLLQLIDIRGRVIVFELPRATRVLHDGREVTEFPYESSPARP
jgi:hypothetical protein